MSKRELRYVAACGMLGTGFRAKSLRAGVARKPDFIGCDAGSNDGGPYLLGTGGITSRARERDYQLALEGAMTLGVPLVIGSCGGSGLDHSVDEMGEWTDRIAKAAGKKVRVAKIYAEPDREVLKAKFRAGKVTPLFGARPIEESTFDSSTHVTAMMGAEALQAAMSEGADVVLAGRCSDSAIFAAMPLARGFDAGLAWHAAKIMECGTAAAANRMVQDSMICTMRDGSFDIEPLDQKFRCTPVSVAAHSLYENSDPYRLVEPGGTVDTTASRYTAKNERIVTVTGSVFEADSPYTMKLEGAEQIGYQSFAFGAIRDPVILDQIESWRDGAANQIRQRISDDLGLDEGRDYALELRLYGVNGVLGRREFVHGRDGHEAVLLMLVTAADEEVAATVARAGNHIAMHFHVPEWSGSITTLAYPFGPQVIDRGPVYRFTLNHAVATDATELLRYDYEEMGAK